MFKQLEKAPFRIKVLGVISIVFLISLPLAIMIHPAIMVVAITVWCITVGWCFFSVHTLEEIEEVCEWATQKSIQEFEQKKNRKKAIVRALSVPMIYIGMAMILLILWAMWAKLFA